MKEELQVIQDLMTDLMAKMEYGEDDFSERLGREKPKAASIEVEIEPSGMEMEEEEMPEEEGMFEEEMGPEEKLKQRLMKLRK